MINRLTLALGALVVALAAGWAIYHLNARNAALRADLRAAEATVQNYRDAARVLTSQIKAERERNAALEATIDDLSTLPGADDALSDYGRAVLDRVR